MIAQIEINHNGDLNIEKKFIFNAKAANFNAVKFQKRDMEIVYSKELLDTPLESPWEQTQRDQKMGLEFGEQECDEITNFLKK